MLPDTSVPHPLPPVSNNEPWWHQAVIYQIYPRSFADSSGDGIGDLQGVIAHLDYLTWLGIDAIWLSPVFQSPMLDFGYDISNHRAIDPLFGTMSDADELIAQAHSRGIRVVFDIVLGHTSSEHPWFRASSSSREHPLRDYYVWRDGPTPGSAEGGPPNNWSAAFPEGTAAWTFDETTAQWYLHSHLPQQPDLNWDNPDVVEEQEKVLRFWLDRGVDGVRLDSINRLGKDPELRDNLLGHPLRQQDWPSVHPRLRRVRTVLEEYGDRLAVGEVWLFEQSQLVPYLADDELHLAHNFPFARTEFDASRMSDLLNEFARLVPSPERAAWFLSNHDEPRTRSRFDADDGRGLQRAELLAVLLLNLQGTVFLYQGEELGMSDTSVPIELRNDRNGRDPQRTPMPWRSPGAAGPGAGFTAGTPWLPLGDEATTVNVASEREDPRSTLNLYRELLALRSEAGAAENPQHVEVVDTSVLSLRRFTPYGERVTVLNFSSQPTTLAWRALGLTTENVQLVLSSDRDRAEIKGRRLSINGLEALVLDVPREGARTS